MKDRNKKRILYTPSGRAGEYANKGYAVNLFSGCTHGCLYCYVPQVLHRDRRDFHEEVKPVKDALKRLERDLAELGKFPEPIFMSFTCDPFPAGFDDEVRLLMEYTRDAIRLIHKSGNFVRLLTKAGFIRTSHILMDDIVEGDEVGVTLTCVNEPDEKFWEPGAATLQDRLNLLEFAGDRGIKTWVSLEPVIYMEQTLELIRRLSELDPKPVLKIGMINNADRRLSPEALERLPKYEPRHWLAFLTIATETVKRLGFEAYFKEDLMKAASGL